jgi:hypothetical protein
MFEHFLIVIFLSSLTMMKEQDTVMRASFQSPETACSCLVGTVVTWRKTVSGNKSGITYSDFSGAVSLNFICSFLVKQRFVWQKKKEEIPST